MSEQDVKTPPHSIEAERAVLGSIMLNTEDRDGDRVFDICQERGITEEWFYDNRHRTVYGAMLDIARASKPLDTVSLLNQLRTKGVLEAIGGADYVRNLYDATPTTAHAEYYMDILKDRVLRRQIIGRATKSIEACYDIKDNPDVHFVLGNAEKALLELEIGGAATQPFDVTLDRSIQAVKEMAASTTRTLLGLSTGLGQLDDLMLGLADTDMIVIGARPSIGKTALALNIAANVAKAGNPVQVFSLEMSRDQLTNRIVCAEGGANLRKLANREIDDPQERLAEARKYEDAAGRMRGLPLFIDDTGDVDIMDLRARARRAKKRHGIRLIVIDYLQLARCRAASKLNNKQLEVAAISSNIKAMAKELNVPVIVLSQFSREVEKREDKKPKLSDLRDSGSIEQDADLVLLLDRPQKELHLDREEASIDVAKNRNGETGEVKVAFEPAYTRFSNLS